MLEVGTVTEPLQNGDTLIAQLDKALEDLVRESALPVADNLQVTIRRINTILEGLTGSTEKFTSTLTHLEQVSLNVRRITGPQNREKFTDLLDNLNSVADQLEKATGKLSPMIDNYSAVADTLKALEIEKTLSKANGALDRLSATLTKINEGEGTLGQLVTNDSLHNQLSETLENLDKLLIHMNEYPKHFFAPLGKKRKKIQKDLNKQDDQGGN